MSYIQEVIVAVCILNVLISIYLVKRDYLNTFQKVAQIIIIWAVPIIGAIALFIIPVKPTSNTVDPPIELEQSRSPALMLSVPKLEPPLGNCKLRDVLLANVCVEISINSNHFI